MMCQQGIEPLIKLKLYAVNLLRFIKYYKYSLIDTNQNIIRRKTNTATIYTCTIICVRNIVHCNIKQNLTGQYIVWVRR